MGSRLAARWFAYWFAPGFGYSIAITRICVFMAVLVSLRRLPFWGGTEAWYGRVSIAAYHPKGIVQLFFPTVPPPAEFVDLLLSLALVAGVMAVVGLCTRAACIVATLLAWFHLGLSYSFVAIWSHPHNVVLLASIAFMFGRSGDRLSVDALLRQRLLGEARADCDREGWYAWPVLLGQAAVALFYFGAFWRKIAGPHDTFELHWVFSDSMRNMLIQPWHVVDLPLPPHVAFVASYPLAWQAVAVGHLLTQALPLLACFHVHRPLLRLAEGVVFAVGVLLLGAFMGYWNEHWLFLAAFFVDWDHFIRKARERPVVASGRPAA